MDEINKILNKGFKITIDSDKDNYYVIVENNEAGLKCKFESPFLLHSLMAAEKYTLKKSVLKEVGRLSINGLLKYNSENPIGEGQERKWYICDCGNAIHLDYVPYYSEVPLLKLSCGHKMSEVTKFTLDTK